MSGDPTGWSKIAAAVAGVTSLISAATGFAVFSNNAYFDLTRTLLAGALVAFIAASIYGATLSAGIAAGTATRRMACWVFPNWCHKEDWANKDSWCGTPSPIRGCGQRRCKSFWLEACFPEIRLALLIYSSFSTLTGLVLVVAAVIVQVSGHNPSVDMHAFLISVCTVAGAGLIVLIFTAINLYKYDNRNLEGRLLSVTSFCPIGIENPRDIQCYQNATVQLLLACEPIRQLIGAQQAANPASTAETIQCRLNDVWNAGTPAARAILIGVGNVPNALGNYVYNDWGTRHNAKQMAGDFLARLLATLQVLPLFRASRSQYYGMVMQETSTCIQCGQAANALDYESNILLLDVTQQISNLRNLVDTFVTTVSVAQCPQCGGPGNSVTRRNLLRAALPRVIFVSLSPRVTAPHVHVPLLLDLDPWCSPPAAPAPYRLQGCIVQVGDTAQTEHNIAYIFTDAEWYCIHDSVVTACSPDHVVTAARNARALAYVRAT